MILHISGRRAVIELAVLWVLCNVVFHTTSSLVLGAIMLAFTIGIPLSILVAGTAWIIHTTVGKIIAQKLGDANARRNESQD